MCAKNRNLTVLLKVLFVSDLRVNLMSARRICSATELQGSFSEHCLWLNNHYGNTVLEVSVREGVYIVKQLAIDKISFINEVFNHTALSAAVEKDNVELIDCDSVSDPSLLTKAKEKFKLWHQWFAHLRAAKLQDLYKVITLKKFISTTTDSDSVCKVCALIKMINKREHYISSQKSNILDFVSINICESLSTSWAEYQYFLKIINNHLRRTWLSFLKDRSETISEIQKWRQKVKLETDCKLAAVCSDNALKLKSILNEWCSLIEISSQYTILYNSLQNSVAEREIWTIENSTRVMLKNVSLLLKFWAEAAKTDVYLQSCVNTDPWVNDESMTSIQAFTGVKPSINHLWVWGCKCYSYVDLRSVLSADKTEKLTD